MFCCWDTCVRTGAFPNTQGGERRKQSLSWIILWMQPQKRLAHGEHCPVVSSWKGQPVTPLDPEGKERSLEQPSRIWSLDLALHTPVKLFSCPSLGTEWPHFSVGTQWPSREETVINPMERRDKVPQPSHPVGQIMEEVQGREVVTAAWFSTQHAHSWKAWRSPLASPFCPWWLIRLSTMTVYSKASTALPRANWLLLLICIQRISSTV